MPKLKDLIPIGKAARALDISRERLRQLADEGRVKVIKDPFGRRYLTAEELARIKDTRASL